MIIAAALKIDLKELKDDFELVDIKIGLSKDKVDSEADIVARNSQNYFNIEINYREHNPVTDHNVNF